MIALPPEDIVRLKNSAKIAQDIENRFARKIEDAIATASDLIQSPDMPVVAPNFLDIYSELWFETYIRSFKHAQSEQDLKKRLAFPRSLREVMRLYDLWRKGKFTPRQAIKYAKEMKSKYLQAVQGAWKKHSEEFREGGEQTQIEVREIIKKRAKTTVARAQTIVRTETTRYYNKARIDYYSQAEDVTHYLFMAVRDKATTPWCMPKETNGKRGRHGLVYAKAGQLLKKESPPCHYNCRSELLPLNKHNPSHRKLIEDPAIRRANVKCYPLPTGW